MNEPVSTRDLTISLVTGDGDYPSNMTNLTYENVTVSVRVLQFFDIGLRVNVTEVDVMFGENATINVTVSNQGNGRDVVDVAVTTVSNISAQPENIELTVASGQERSFLLTIEPLTDMRSDMNLLIIATSEGNPGVLAKGTIVVHVRT
jgi:hypothetical protein